jgi:hypothetical protein
MELRGGSVDITRILPRGFTPIPLEDGIVGSATLDKTLFCDLVGG